MAKSKVQVGTSAVRTHEAVRAAFEGAAFLGETARGRVPQAAIDLYEKETGHKVVTGFKAEKVYDLKVPTTDSKGRKRTKTVRKTTSEVRALAGETAGAKGVLGAKQIAAAEAALLEQMKG